MNFFVHEVIINDINEMLNTSRSGIDNIFYPTFWTTRLCVSI